VTGWTVILIDRNLWVRFAHPWFADRAGCGSGTIEDGHAPVELSRYTQDVGSARVMP